MLWARKDWMVASRSLPAFVAVWRAWEMDAAVAMMACWVGYGGKGGFEGLGVRMGEVWWVWGYVVEKRDALSLMMWDGGRMRGVTSSAWERMGRQSRNIWRQSIFFLA